MPIKVGSVVPPRGEVVDGDVAVDREPEPIPLDGDPEVEDPDDEPGIVDDPPDPGTVVVPLRGSADPLAPEPEWAWAMRLQFSKSAFVGVLLWAAARPHKVARLAVVTMAVVNGRLLIGTSSRMRLERVSTSISRSVPFRLRGPAERPRPPA